MRDAALQRWLDRIRARDVLDWRLLESPTAQYPSGRWEALVEFSYGETWVLAPPEVLP